jgi:hypothetical protein
LISIKKRNRVMEAIEMASKMERYFPIGETVRADGSIVVVEKRRGSRRGPRGGSTARHEARHAVAAIANGTGVVYATIIPGPGYRGLTQLSGFDAVAAAAPHAHGDDGTGHDVSIIERAGHSVGAAGSAAKSILAERHEHVEAVASALQTEGSLSGSRIREIMSDIDKGPEIIIKIFFPNAKKFERTIRRRMDGSDGILLPEDLPIEVPKATNADFELPRSQIIPRSIQGISV